MTTIAQTRQPPAIGPPQPGPSQSDPLTKVVLRSPSLLSASRSTGCSSSPPGPTRRPSTCRRRCSPAATWARTSRGCSPPRTRYFVTGLIELGRSSSVTVTLSVVLISTLAGFAFAKLRFRGRKLLLGLDPAHHDGAAPADGHRAAVPAHGDARLDRHAAGGDPAVPGQRVRRLHDDAVRRAGRARRAGRGGPRRRRHHACASTGTSSCPRSGPAWRCSACWCSCRTGTSSCGR